MSFASAHGRPEALAVGPASPTLSCLIHWASVNGSQTRGETL